VLQSACPFALVPVHVCPDHVHGDSHFSKLVKVLQSGFPAVLLPVQYGCPDHAHGDVHVPTVFKVLQTGFLLYYYQYNMMFLSIHSCLYLVNILFGQ